MCSLISLKERIWKLKFVSPHKQLLYFPLTSLFKICLGRQHKLVELCYPALIAIGQFMEKGLNLSFSKTIKRNVNIAPDDGFLKCNCFVFSMFQN